MNQSLLIKIGLIVSVLLIVGSAIGFFVCEDKMFSYLYFAVGLIYLILNLNYNRPQQHT